MTRTMPIVSTAARATALLWSAPALAQDAPDTPAAPVPQTYADTEITVTGSRIQRDGFRAPTPLTVLNSEDIESSAPANIADYVNDIPSLVGSVTPASSNLNISAGTAGVNALNLPPPGNIGTAPGRDRVCQHV